MLLALVPLAACSQPRDYGEARALIASRCAACHTVPGVPGAHGKVGPTLQGIAKRQVIAGKLPNTPANLRSFLEHPQAVEPGGAMPELGLTAQQAAAIAYYLYTLDKP
ncbi:c-type cytochrome [Sphingomonas sp.]|jgi:cytochrome c2|uniref:c-type cytochrome n=1 Tax=Sphingomonas sp. TaxID=28214 RepID=UPI002E34D121|nr:c-type cytochrome [Sphingomonas sp.]HEX4694720.1 c-type cytochrome [Sphingomonas sp.]